jgi:hypothetical protein
MNFLKRGFKESVKAVKKHKILFLSIIVLQIILITMLTYISLNYQLKIIEGAQEVIIPLNEANYDQASLEAGQPFTKDIMQIYTGYKTMMKNIIEYILWLSCIFLLINGLIWMLVYRMFEKRKFIEYSIKYLASSLALVVPFFIVCYFILKAFLSLEIATEAFASVIQVMTGFFIIIYYFLLVGFSQLYIKNWKNFVKSYYQIGIKKILSTLTVLVINGLLILFGIYLIYLTSLYEVSLVVMLLAMLFLVITLVLTKIFWVSCLNKLEK